MWWHSQCLVEDRLSNTDAICPKLTCGVINKLASTITPSYRLWIVYLFITITGKAAQLTLPGKQRKSLQFMQYYIKGCFEV